MSVILVQSRTSGLLLKAGKLTEEAEDGLLTAEDITGLDLLATELVVLSASRRGWARSTSARGSSACVAPSSWPVPRRWS